MCPATGELRPPPASTMRDLPHTSACNESAQPCASRANWERVSMNAPTQSQKAQHFRALHAGPRMLVLPNAWDVISARLIEEAGFPAIATSSAGVAWALGFPDGERISRGEMLAVVRRIAASVRIPVSADVEAGYGATPEAAAVTARGVIAAGGSGVDLEGGAHQGPPLRPPPRWKSSSASACAGRAWVRESCRPRSDSSAGSPWSCATTAALARWPTW